MRNSILTETNMNSPLAAQSDLRPKKSGLKKTLDSQLILTSLVDAFSILVIYLLVSTTGGVKDYNGQIKLPTVNKASDTFEGTIVQIKKNRYFIDDKPVSKSQIAAFLNSIKTADRAKHQLVIEADKDSNFSAVNPVITQASNAGFYKFNFAVIQRNEK